MRRGGRDLPEHLPGLQQGAAGEGPGRRRRAGQAIGPHPEHVGRGRKLKRISPGIEHEGPGRELCHDGQPLARTEVRVDDARRPLDLPAAADPAQAEVAAIFPHASLLGEVDRGREGRIRGIAMLDDRLHRQEQLRRIELRESPLQPRGDRVRGGRGQRARGGVLLLLPGDQERLHGGLRGKLRSEAGGQADDQHADGHDDERGETRPLRSPDRGRGLAAGPARRARSHMAGRPTPAGGQPGGPGPGRCAVLARRSAGQARA